MASFVLFIFTVFLLPVARSAKCNVCANDRTLSCGGDPEDCPEKSTCISVASRTTLSINKKPISSSSRSCVNPTNNLTGSFYFDFGNASTLDFTSEVCDEKSPDCNANIQDPPIRMYENGKSCPRCFRTGYDNCNTDGEVLCVGDLVNCVDMNGKIAHKFSGLNITTTIPFAGKGCVSKAVCEKFKDTKTVHFGTYNFTFEKVDCTKANGALSSLRRLAFTLEKKDLGPQVAFFFPCILGIFAVKILS